MHLNFPIFNHFFLSGGYISGGICPGCIWPVGICPNTIYFMFINIITVGHVFVKSSDLYKLLLLFNTIHSTCPDILRKIDGKNSLLSRI